MTRMANEYERADHDRDLRKHDDRPGDRDFPARFDKPLTTAMDIVALVKLTPNFSDCERLVQQYADMIAASARADEARIAADRLGRLANAQA